MAGLLEKRNALAIQGRKGGGKAGGGGSGRVAKEDPNTLESSATARVLDFVSEGPIVGLVDGLKSVYLDGTPVQNNDGSYNFEGVELDTREGLPDQPYIPGYPDVEREESVGAEVKQDTPVVRTVSDLNANALRIKVRLPALTSQDTKTGDVHGTSVQIAIDVKPFGGVYTEFTTDTINGKTTSPYERAYRVALPAGGAPWDVRVRRITVDSETLALRNQTYFSAYTVLIDAKLTYPDCAIMALNVDSKLFGTDIPGRGYHIRGRIVRVPDNYAPDTRVYTGLWSGEFKLAWTQNPAWVFYDMATHQAYGLGEFVDDQAVDKWGLYQIAQYCDELVPDGLGGTEPRFTFNWQFNAQEEAFTVLNSIASTFRGMLYWASAAMFAVQDAPADAVKLVTHANTIDGDFNYEGTALESRHSTVIVWWNNPDDEYRRTPEVVEDADLVHKLGYRPMEVTAFGCTSRGQAYRMGLWALYSEQSETQQVTYRAGMDHADLFPGQIVALADKYWSAVRFGGRLKGIDGTAVTLDQAVTLASGHEYKLSLVMPGGELVEKTVTSNPGSHSVLTVDSIYPDTPVAAGLWVLSGTDVKPRLFRVRSVNEVEGHLFEVKALEHNPGKFALIEDGLALEPIATSRYPTGALAPASDLTIEEGLYKLGSEVKTRATFSWTASADIRAVLYETQVRRFGEPSWQASGATTGHSIDIPDIVRGEYSFRVRPLTNTGRPGPWTEISKDLLSYWAPPDVVTGFEIQVIDGQAYLSWDAHPALDLSHYEVRYFAGSPDVAVWGGAITLLVKVTGTTATVPALPGTYLIKAVDLTDVESETAALVGSSIVSAQGRNVVEVIDQVGFPGVVNNCGFDAGLGGLRLDSADNIFDFPNFLAVENIFLGPAGLVTSGEYEFDRIFNAGRIDTSRVTAVISLSGTKVDDNVLDDPDFLGLSNIFGVGESDYSVELQISTTQDDPNGAPTWSAWSRFVVGDYAAWGLKFRLVLRGHSWGCTPVVQTLAVTIDMTDRVETSQDLVCPVEGLRITYQNPFQARPWLSVDGQGLAQGDRPIITNADSTGFNLVWHDSLDQPVARSFDYYAKGYGKGI